jgi:hypothetical protein
MEPAVEAAIIGGCFGLLGVAGTVWVAIAGFRANRRIFSESAQAERARSLQEKQWAAYEEILGILDDRQAYRLEVMNKARTAKADGADIKSFISIATKLADFHDPETRGARGRLMAYASPKVRTAFLQMIVDDTAMGLTAVTRTVALATRTVALYAQHQTRFQVEGGAVPDPEDFWPKFEELHKLVQKRDQELTDLIRQELGSDPPQVPPVSPPQTWHGVIAPNQGQ